MSMEEIARQIADNIERVKERIAGAAQRSGRNPEDISLVCVTKNFPAHVIQYALQGGSALFGENRVQELLEKYEHVQPRQWHLIGHLQTNKVKYIVGKVELIQSVDSIRLLEEIERQSQKQGLISKVLLQVNTSGEESKFGAAPEELDALCEKAATLSHVKVSGLMTIAPLCVSEVATRLHFANTRRLYIDIANRKYDNISMECLSMGMSADFEEAILEGSNMVRVGSAIFGKRIY